MNSSALSSIPFSGNNSSFGFHCFAGIQLDTATGSLKSLSTYTTSLRFFLNKQPLFRRMKKTRESLSRTFSLDRWLERRKCLSEVDALYLVWCLVLDPRSLWKLAVKLFQALLAGKSLILRQDMTLKIVEIERVNPMVRVYIIGNNETVNFRNLTDHPNEHQSKQSRRNHRSRYIKTQYKSIENHPVSLKQEDKLIHT